MKRLCLICCLILELQALSAQNVNPIAFNRELWRMANYVDWLNEYDSPTRKLIEGNMYLWPEWQRGEIHFTDGTSYGRYPLQLNVFFGRVHLMHPDQGMLSLQKGMVQGFTLEDEAGKLTREFRRVDVEAAEFRPFTFKYEGELFGEVLYEGERMLMKISEKKLKETRTDDPFQRTNAQNSIISRVTYLLLDEEGGYEYFLPGKLSLYLMAPEHKAEMKAFIKSQDLKPKHESDLIVCLTFLESLEK